MTAASNAITAGQSVWAELRYIVNTGVKPTVYVSSRNAGRSTRREVQVDIRRMEIQDARPLVAQASLDREGIELRVQSYSVTDFDDDEEVERIHYREIERLIRHATGTTRALVFDHIRRSSADNRAGARSPVFSVHNDYTPRSGVQRVRDLFPDEAEGLLKRRFSLINAWHSTRGRAESFPLAICDAQSIRPEDLIATNLVYDSDDGEVFSRAQTPERVGEIFNLAYSPDHLWFYLPRMERDETLLFKCFDSALDGRARLTAHSAIMDPNSAPDAEPRESTELRALAFFG